MMINETPQQTFERYLKATAEDGHIEGGVRIENCDNEFWVLSILGNFKRLPREKSKLGTDSDSCLNQITVISSFGNFEDMMKEGQRRLLEQEPWKKL